MARKSGTRAPVGAPSDWIKNEGKRVPAIFFRTEAGGEPVRGWLKALPSPADRKRIGEDIQTVEFGWPVGMPVSRPLGDGIYEVRTRLTPEPDIEGALLHRPKAPHGTSARIYQEDARNAGRRSGTGAKQQE